MYAEPLITRTSSDRRKRLPGKYNYKKLIDDDANFRRWYENIRRGSPASADARLRRIGYVCRVFDTTTKKLASMNAKEGSDLIFESLPDLKVKARLAST